MNDFMEDVDRLARAAMEAMREKRPTMVVTTELVIALVAMVKMASHIGRAKTGAKVDNIIENTFAELRELVAVGEVQEWHQLDRRAGKEHLGMIPGFIDVNDQRPLAAQLDAAYQHGGGFPSSSLTWQAKWRYDPKTHVLTYPPDEAGEAPETFHALWKIIVRGEELLVFDHAIVMVRDVKGGSFVIGRMD